MGDEADAQRLLPNELMIPGKTYITKLPGDNRPSFVRRRSGQSLHDTLDRLFSYPRPLISNKMMSWSYKNFVNRDLEYHYLPRGRRRVLVRTDYDDAPLPDYIAPHGVRRGRLATNVAQTCAACGKFRSPSWSSRHGLNPGEVVKPGLCKKCRDKSTSSEESDFTRKKRKKHRHCGHRCSSSEEDCSKNHRHHRRYHDHDHRRYRSPSRESVNIIVNNDPVAQSIHPIVSEPSSSSSEEIEIVRKTLPHSRARHSVIVEEHQQRKPRRKSSYSSVRVVRSPSPRRPHVVHGYGSWPRHRRRRSTSHVSFADEEEIIASRPRHHSRGARVYYDGANSGQSEMNSPPSVEIPGHESESTQSDPKLIEIRPTDPDIFAAANARSTLPYRQANIKGEPVSKEFSTRQSSLSARNENRSFDSRSSRKEKSTKRSVQQKPSILQQSDDGSDREASSMQYTRPLSPSTDSTAPDAADAEEAEYRAKQQRGFSEPGPASLRLPNKMWPDDPNHPDHDAWKMGMGHVIPVENEHGEWELHDNTKSSFSSQETAQSTNSVPTTPTDDSAPYYHIPQHSDYPPTSYCDRGMSRADEEYFMEIGRQKCLAEQKDKEQRERERLENAYNLDDFWEGGKMW